MKDKYLEVFKKQQKHQREEGQWSYKKRMRLLNALQYAVEQTYRAEIAKALHKD